MMEVWLIHNSLRNIGVKYEEENIARMKYIHMEIWNLIADTVKGIPVTNELISDERIFERLR